jgi:hypothetical protein
VTSIERAEAKLNDMCKKRAARIRIDRRGHGGSPCPRRSCAL